jgi:hypothetical protein
VISILMVAIGFVLSMAAAMCSAIEPARRLRRRVAHQIRSSVLNSNLLRLGALVHGQRRVCLLASHTTSGPPIFLLGLADGRTHWQHSTR